MLDELKHFFTGYGPLELDKHGQPSDQALKIATAAVLWEASLADDFLGDLEVSKLTAALKGAFNISEEEVQVVSAICQRGVTKDKLDKYINMMVEHYDEKQREKIIELASVIVKADNELDLSEAIVCDLLRKRLKLA